jgi:N-sulfoglucosamine sulfohydrolase
MKKPNILFAIADDASHMSAYGHTFVNTPHFDRVASEGVLFMNAFTTNPKCAPSRASIVTGMHTWQLEEAGNHHGIFPAKFSVFPDILEEAGYFVGYTGKGWGPGDWAAGGRHQNPAGVEFNIHQSPPPENTEISSKDYAANFEEFLNSKEKDQPFCFWYGAHEPHRKYKEGEGIRAGKELKVVQVPPYLPDDDIVKSDLLDYAYETEWFDRHLGLMLSKLESIGELDNTVIVATSDNGMPFPRVKGQMYDVDFRLPLAMRWGDGLKSGKVVDQLVSFIDFAPTFLEAAGIKKHPQMQGESLIGICETNQTPRDFVVMGRERHDMGSEGDRSYPVRCIRTDQYLYVRNFDPDAWPAGNPETGFTNVDSSPTKSLILEQQKKGIDFYYNLAFAKHPSEELFDVKKDPYCMNNLAEESEFSDLKTKLWGQLKQLLEETKDPRILGNGEIFNQYKYVGPNKLHSWEAYVGGWWEKQKY